MLILSVKSNKKTSGSYAEKYHDDTPYSFTYKLVCVDNKFSNIVVLYRGENAAENFIKLMLEDLVTVKK